MPKEAEIMDKLKGYRTLLVAAAYVVLGVAGALGMGLDAAQTAQADTVVEGLVSLALNPVVMAIVFAVLRLVTKMPVGGTPPPADPSGDWPTG